jgi:hypothetical protein
MEEALSEPESTDVHPTAAAALHDQGGFWLDGADSL